MAYVDLNPIRTGISHTPEALNSISKGIVPCSRQDYFELVDRTGRVINEGKAGAIPEDLALILERIQINPKTWGHNDTIS